MSIDSLKYIKKKKKITKRTVGNEQLSEHFSISFPVIHRDKMEIEDLVLSCVWQSFYFALLINALETIFET